MLILQILLFLLLYTVNFDFFSMRHPLIIGLNLPAFDRILRCRLIHSKSNNMRLFLWQHGVAFCWEWRFAQNIWTIARRIYRNRRFCTELAFVVLVEVLVASFVWDDWNCFLGSIAQQVAWTFRWGHSIRHSHGQWLMLKSPLASLWFSRI